MATLNRHMIALRSITVRSPWVSMPKQYRFLATPASGWKTESKQQQQQSTNNKKNKESTMQSKQPILKMDATVDKKYKHLYYVPVNPHVAAQRVAKIAKAISVDEALEYLKLLRIGLQSTAAWNIIMQQYAKQGNASQAEKCFVQMRKRSIPPNEQSFTVLISAWARSSSPAAIRNAEQVIERMARYNIQPTIFHYNTLLLVYQKTDTPIQEFFANLPCTPNEFTYSMAFQCADNIDFVKQLWDQIQNKIAHAQKKKSSLAEKAQQVTMTEEALRGKDDDEKIKETPFVLDDRLVASFLNALSKTAVDEDDIQLGIDAIEQLYGLHAPSNHNNPGLQKKHTVGVLTPTVYSLDSILRFCGRSKRYKLGREYYDVALKHNPSLVPDQALLEARDWLDGAVRFDPKKQQQHHHHRNTSPTFHPSYVNKKSR